MIATPDAHPAGTRVRCRITGRKGVVLGWLRDNIKIGWDGGGTSCGPAHHKSLTTDDA